MNLSVFGYFGGLGCWSACLESFLILKLSRLGNTAGSLPSSGQYIYCSIAQRGAELPEPEAFSPHPIALNYRDFAVPQLHYLTVVATL